MPREDGEDMDNERWSTRALAAAGGVGAFLAARELTNRAREESLDGQVALITGGSKGLGLAMARELADEGCQLVICARDEVELQQAGEGLERRGADVLAVRCDVSDRDDVQRMVDAAHETFGRIDVLICNAGVIQVGQVHSMELEDFRQAMDIMYWGVLYPILAVLPEMRQRRAGRIAVVASIGGKVSVPYLLPYNGAKFAAVGLAEGLRAELADERITVTTIVPGLMRTGSYLNAQFSGDRAGQESTYRTFVPLSSLPLLTASGESAARAFVRAIQRGEGEYIYPPQYGLVARLHGLAPATTTRILGFADRLLPETEGGQEPSPGREIEARLEPGAIWRGLTVLGRRAVDRLQQRPGAI
jgi:NAD(P)-dependent dehydrogenase (short-subunit alcohol dehydrogenase family)